MIIRMVTGDPSPHDAGGQQLKTVMLAFRIVELIHERRSVGVTEVAEEMDLPKSTAHLQLKTLVETGFAYKEDGRYTLSFQFLEIGGAMRNQLKLYEVAKPVLKDLAEKSNELAELQIEERGRGVLLMRFESENAVDDNTPIGQYEHLHTSAVGKSILASLPAEYVEAIIDKHGLPPRTTNTITDPDELMLELQWIRNHGIAYSEGEAVTGVRGVGAPIRTNDDQVVGAISVSGPNKRISDERLKQDLRSLVEEASNIIELKIRHY